MIRELVALVERLTRPAKQVQKNAKNNRQAQKRAVKA